MPKNLAVLASGTGSLLKAMIEDELPIKLVLVDRKCRALEIAREAGIPFIFIPRSFDETFNREAFTIDVLCRLQHDHIGLVAMAGFMTIFSPVMFAEARYRMKILNTHPSLLPAFKGHHAVRDALASGVKVTGCTIHFATEELDAGPILAQEAVKVLPGDTVESLHERIKVVERELYPMILRKLIS
jgi:phosphoribosylglycinamide formyltransferase 1